MSLTILMKSAIIIYLSLLLTTFSTNNTVSMLNDHTNSSAHFQAQWVEEIKWDKSSLEFKGQGGIVHRFMR